MSAYSRAGSTKPPVPRRGACARARLAASASRPPLPSQRSRTTAHLLQHHVFGEAFSERILEGKRRVISLAITPIELPRGGREAVLELVLQLSLHEKLAV